MSRPLRSEFPGALYHVTARGNRRSAIFFDETDRMIWFDILATVCARFNFVVHAYCQMTNHYHLMLETNDGSLAKGMRQLNSVYSQRINRRHKLTGHLFQGRYKAILVQKESHLLELSRYVVLNPVRSEMVSNPEDWAWSSYSYFMQYDLKPAWLEVDWLLRQFGTSYAEARLAYRDFVHSGKGAASPLRDVQHQMLLGDQAFIENFKNGNKQDVPGYASRVQRKASALSLREYAQQYPDRNESMARAFRSQAYSMKEIARFFKTSARTVSRAVQKFETATIVPNDSERIAAQSTLPSN